MSKEELEILENFIKLNATTKFDFFGDKQYIALEHLLQAYKDSTPNSKIEEEIEKSKEEYNNILNSIDNKVSHMKDQHKIRATYAEFGFKKGKLDALQELLEE